jgi:hypothetical protein
MPIPSSERSEIYKKYKKGPGPFRRAWPHRQSLAPPVDKEKSPFTEVKGLFPQSNASMSVSQ